MTDQTKHTYENPDFVKIYLRENKNKEWDIKNAVEFAQSLPAQSVILDLGCGPGHLSYVMASATSHEGNPLLDRVIGTDYSDEMINTAKGLHEQSNTPEFEVRDMLKLGTDYTDNTFDGVFSNASLLHLNRNQVVSVLEDIVKVTKNGGKVFINLKKGNQETKVVQWINKGEDQESELSREFTFWMGEDFSSLAESCGLKLEKFDIQSFPATSGQPTEWLYYHFIVVK